MSAVMMFKTNTDVIAHHQREAPVDVKAIATDLGLHVYQTDDWDENIAGAIFADGDGYSIYVNSKHSRERQRFTVAHQLAHYLLHRDLIGKGLTDSSEYRSKLSDVREVEANRMAAEILMPWGLITSLMDGGTRDLPELAERLEVSLSMLKVRLGVPFLNGE